MKRLVLAACAAALACGSPPKPIATGTLQNQAITLRTTAGWMNGTTLEAVATSSSNTCEDVQKLSAAAGDQLLYLALTHLDPQGVHQAIVPQTYQVKPPLTGDRYKLEASVLLLSADPASKCAQTRLVASNGSVTLTSFDGTTGAAQLSFALQFGTDQLNGDLDTTACHTTADVGSANLACH